MRTIRIDDTVQRLAVIGATPMPSPS